MKQYKTTTKTILLLLLLLCAGGVAEAQPGFGDDVDDTPIDGGLSLLVAGGIGYGLRKMRRKNNDT